MDGSADPVSEVQQDEGKAAAGVSQIKKKVFIFHGCVRENECYTIDIVYGILEFVCCSSGYQRYGYLVGFLLMT